jgi:DNA-binding NarL/FixJ family response regulator
MKGARLVRLVDSVASFSDEFHRLAPLVAQLSPRQQAVLQLLGLGLDNRDICNKLGIGEPTVKHHVSKILHALRLANRTKAAICVAWMLAHGVLRPSDAPLRQVN